MRYKTTGYRFFEPVSLRFFLSLFAKQALLSLAKKKAQERGDEEYGPEEEESDVGTPKKGRKKKEEPDTGLTMGTDVEDYLKQDGKKVKANPEDIKFDEDKKKGHIRRKDPKLLAKRVESLEASPPTRPIYVVLLEDNSTFVSCVASHARGLAHQKPYLSSQMGNTGARPDNTALRLLTPSAIKDKKVVWLC